MATRAPTCKAILQIPHRCCYFLLLSRTESRTPALTSDELKSFSSSTDKSTNPQPTIATPKEPASLGEGSIGVSAGDPAGGANVMSAAKAAGRGLLVRLCNQHHHDDSSCWSSSRSHIFFLALYSMFLPWAVSLLLLYQQ